ncbi:MAG TPA: Yip1 family protein [Candidatus Nanoarchaeia archaeon]|nr:Yip1 family protein [Candidatus Nanoarchaeia archaeon]
MNLLNKITGILIKPEETIKEISDRPYIEEAFLIVGIIAILSAISAYLMPIIYDFSDLPPEAMEIVKFSTTVLPILSALIGIIIMWIIAAGIIHFISVALGGEGKFTQMLVVYGYSRTPLIINAVFGIILFSFIEPITITMTAAGAGNPMGEMLSNPYYVAIMIIGYIMQLWAIGLMFLGVKYVHNLSTNKALIAMALPILFFVLGIVTTLFSNVLFG